MSEKLIALIDLLDGDDIRTRIREMVHHLDGIGEADSRDLTASMDTRLHGLAASLRDVCFEDDVTEAQSMLPWIWIELRFEWMRYNMQMQYQTMLLGTAQPLLMARGAALSSIVDAVELHMDAESAFLMQKIAADPAGTARGAIERTDRLFALMAAASAGSRDAVESLMVAQDQIARHTDSVPIRHELNKAISAVIEKVGAALRVSVLDFSHALEGVMIRQLGQAPVRVTLSQESPDYNLSVPSGVANALLKAGGQWMEAMATTSLYQSAEARIAAGQPAYVTLRAALRRSGERIELSLADDADGTVEFRPDHRMWPIRDLKMAIQQTPGTGSSMIFGCDVTTFTEYMTLRVGNDPNDALIGIPIRLVDHIELRDATAIAVRGTRLIHRQHGGTLRLIDLGDAMFQNPIPVENATYVLVQSESNGGETLALRVRGVEGTCRGSLKAMPELLTNAPLRGFVQADRKVIGIIDFERLLRHETVIANSRPKAA
ncbi:chemotaxis protein CheW [Gemmatimonas sp.]|uniref:chemotaxis protein CheW n=1 Tax=Gemmatimonas sp. TaxID=1962908 RepID=UPI0035668EEA